MNVNSLRGLEWSFKIAWPVFYAWAKGGPNARDKKYVDPSDVFIILYIHNLEASKSARVSSVKNDEGFVWVDYGTLLKSIPLLDLGKAALSRRLQKLVDLGILEKDKTRSATGGGWKTRVYFKTTAFFDEEEEKIGRLIEKFYDDRKRGVL